MIISYLKSYNGKLMPLDIYHLIIIMMVEIKNYKGETHADI